MTQSNTWTQIPTDAVLDVTSQALTSHGIAVHIVESGAEAKAKVQSLIPTDAEVMDMTSETLRVTGIAEMINEGSQYTSIKKILSSMNRETDSPEMQKIGAAPEWAVGSVHAVTQDGSVFIASNTGSQLPAYAYAASHVIWVVGAQKVVRDSAKAIQRIYEHTLPLESERARKAYGVAGSHVNKLLTINGDNPGRLTMVLVKEVLGF